MNHLFSLPLFLFVCSTTIKWLFSSPQTRSIHHAGKPGPRPLHAPPVHRSSFPCFSFFTLSTLKPVIRMKNGDGPMAPFHPPSPLLTRSLLAPGDITKYCCLRGSELFLHLFQQRLFSPLFCCFLVKSLYVLVCESVLSFTSTQNCIIYHTEVIKVHL